MLYWNGMFFVFPILKSDLKTTDLCQFFYTPFTVQLLKVSQS